jgi:hypothetical protein
MRSRGRKQNAIVHHIGLEGPIIRDLYTWLLARVAAVFTITQVFSWRSQSHVGVRDRLAPVSAIRHNRATPDLSRRVMEKVEVSRY